MERALAVSGAALAKASPLGSLVNTVVGVIGPLTLQVDPEPHAVSQADAVTRDARECDKLRQTETCHGIIVRVGNPAHRSAIVSDRERMVSERVIEW